MAWTKQRLNNLFFFLGCAACVVMLFTFDVSFVELWQHICHAGYWLIPILGIWIVVYGLNAFAWQAIIKGNCKEGQQLPSFWRIYRLTITGYALNYATPVGGLGGEPYRIMELSKDIDNQHATSSVILYAMMHFFAHFWFWFISIFIYLALVLVGDMPMTTAIAIVLGTIILFCLVAFYIFSRGYRHGLVVYVLGLIGKIPFLKGWSRRFRGKHAEALRNIDAQISALYSQDTKAFTGRHGTDLPPLCSHCGLHHTVCQPHRFPAHADWCTGGWFRTEHRCFRAVCSLRHLCQHHLSRTRNSMDSHRNGTHEDTLNIMH